MIRKSNEIGELKVSSKTTLCALAAFIVICLAPSLAHAVEIKTKGRVVYADYGQRKLKLTLRLPDDGKQELRPAVILIHGGCWAYGTRHQLHWYGKRLAERGYVTAAISYRMMPRYPFPACLHDCKAAVKWMRLHAKEYGVDPDRIAVMGNSAGGHLTELLAETRPEDDLEGPQYKDVSSEVQAAVVMYGVADLSYYLNAKGYIDLGGLSKAFVKSFVGKDAHGKKDPFAWASPVTYAHPEVCPVLFVHGTKDHFVPYVQSTELCDQLARMGVKSRLITVPYGHIFDFFHPRARKDFFEKASAFLDECLKPEQTKAP
jgi:acetyl esterase/lipase